MHFEPLVQEELKLPAPMGQVRRWRLFLCPAIVLVLLSLPVALLFGLAGLAVLGPLLLASAGVLYLCCGCPVLFLVLWMKSWSLRCCSVDWVGDLYGKVLFLILQDRLLSYATPTTEPKDMPVSGLRQKCVLEKWHVNYALNIQVPKRWEEEFHRPVVDCFSRITARLRMAAEQDISMLPFQDYFDVFEPGEDPVEYVMKQVGNVYPFVRQAWPDKHSDEALARFCLCGLGAHRIETAEVDGVRHHVVRANQLAGLPMRPGFARYGGDAYFDQNWRPVMIVDEGLGADRSDGIRTASITRPGDADWELAKFRFRSSVSVLVTAVDHLFGIHLLTSNLMVTAVREQLSADHPMRRFLTPFTFNTISVNHEAHWNLVAPRTQAIRVFGVTDKGMQLMFAAAPKLLKSGFEVPKEEGGPILDQERYVEWLLHKGVDTEFLRMSVQFWRILRRFVVSYLDYYYDSHAALVADAELANMIRQYLTQTREISAVALMHPAVDTGYAAGRMVPTELVERYYETTVSIITSFCYNVTAGHEHAGAVEAYVQDASFCAFKFTPGALMGTKESATSTALLMAFTSTPMPQLLGSDWTHLFAPRSEPPPGRPDPIAVFQAFQNELRAFSEFCDAQNARCIHQPFPDNFPIYVFNPRLLEISISV